MECFNLVLAVKMKNLKEAGHTTDKGLISKRAKKKWDVVLMIHININLSI